LKVCNTHEFGSVVAPLSIKLPRAFRVATVDGESRGDGNAG
jgi:hypothetical protein